MSDHDRKQFLMDLDESEEHLTEWEGNFLDSMMEEMPRTFSDRQRECIDRMIVKYDDKL